MTDEKNTGATYGTSGTPMTLPAEMQEGIRIFIRSEMQEMIRTAIEDYAAKLRPDSVEIDEDAKGVGHPKIKSYANTAQEASVAALAAYRATKRGIKEIAGD